MILCPGAEVLRPDPWQRTQVNQPWRCSWCHQGYQGQQVSRPKWYSEQGLEVSSPASGFPPGPDFQRISLHPSLSQSVEVRLCISILKPGKVPALPSSYWPLFSWPRLINYLKKIILTRILYEVRERGRMRDEQFGFPPNHSTSLQLVRLVKRITRNFSKEANRSGYPRRGQGLRCRLYR